MMAVGEEESGGPAFCGDGVGGESLVVSGAARATLPTSNAQCHSRLLWNARTLIDLCLINDIATFKVTNSIKMPYHFALNHSNGLPCGTLH